MDNISKKEVDCSHLALVISDEKKVNFKESKQRECVVCFMKPKLLKLPCCSKPICKQCITKIKECSVHNPQCPHCRQTIKVEKKKETVTRFTCYEFWTMFYFVSYLFLSITAIGFAIYDIYARSDSDGDIADNILVGIIANGCIIWWFSCEYFNEKGDITKMPSTWWGLGPSIGTFVIRFALYAAPLPSEFMRTYFCSFLLVCESVAAFYICWGILFVLMMLWKAIRPIFCECGHKEDRETSKVELSMP